MNLKEERPQAERAIRHFEETGDSLPLFHFCKARLTLIQAAREDYTLNYGELCRLSGPQLKHLALDYLKFQGFEPEIGGG